MIKTITIECSLTDLMEVLNATGNAKVATDILNGTYVAPDFPKEIIGEFRTKREKAIVDGIHEEEIEIKEPIMYKALNYNPFTNMVHFQCKNSYGSMRDDAVFLSDWLTRNEKNGEPYALGA